MTEYFFLAKRVYLILENARITRYYLTRRVCLVLQKFTRVYIVQQT